MTTKHALSCLFIVCALSLGCTPTHRAVPVLEAGYPLHLVVDIPDDQVYDASGAVYFSMPSEKGSYAMQQMTLRGDDLVTTLKTEDLEPGDRVLYYFEVFADGKARSLGSAQRPYITDILDRDMLLLRSIESGVEFKEAGLPVVFFLDTAGYATQNPIVRYSPPDLPGIIEQAMVFNGKVWVAEVPGQRVAPGSWSYRIQADVQDIGYVNPADPDQPIFFKVPPRK
jgi:hypothetical protein